MKNKDSFVNKGNVRSLLILLAFIVTTYPLFAQLEGNSFSKTPTFGLKAGYNLSKAQSENFTSSPKWGMAAGAFFTLPIGEIFGLQPEVLYSQKGFKGSGTILGSPYEVSRTTDYIDIPLFISAKVFKGLNFLVGPQLSYLVRQTDVFTNSGITIQQQENFHNDNIRKNVFGIIGGFDINIQHAVIGARMGWDVLTNNGDGTTSTPRYQNAWIQGTIGYRF